MNVERRNLFKLLAVGAGVGFVTHALGSETVKLLKAQGDAPASGEGDALARKQQFDAFEVVEQDGTLNISTASGEPLFIIDKEK